MSGSDDAVPPLARALFGAGLARAEYYVALLADTGVTHGLIGPREVPRLWERHVLNCAVIAPAIASGVEVIDVGSGAGLPGLPLAIARPDLQLRLIEPLLRRATWLTDAVEALGLENVTVHRDRAQDLKGTLIAPVVTARAVARLASLAQWCLPLLSPGGSLLALKGISAAAELEADRAALRALGVRSADLELFGEGVLEPPARVVRIVKSERASTSAASRGARGGSPRRRHVAP